MPSRQRVRPHVVSVALALCAVAGFVDAFGFEAVFHVYTANMSGNSVALAIALGKRDLLHAVERGWPILMYVIGLLISSLVLEVARRKNAPRVLSLALFAEMVFLALFLVLGMQISPPDTSNPHSLGSFIILVTFPALAMGVQNVTLRKAGGVSLFTTHVTGTLTKMVVQATAFFFWLHERFNLSRRWRLRRLFWAIPRQANFLHAAELASMWIIYMIGGVLAVLGQQMIGFIVLLAPIIVLAIVAIRSLVRHPPLPPDEEQDAPGSKIVPV